MPIELQIFGTVIDLAKALAGMVGWVNGMDEKRRARLASLFEAISTLLEDFREKRQQGRQAPGLCAELKQYANALREVASGTLSCPEIERLALELAGVCEALQQLSTGSNERSNQLYEEYLDQLADGAGIFRGVANVLRAQ